MYSSCALRSASPAAPGNSTMPKATSTSAARRARRAMIDQPRQHRRQRAFAIANRAQCLHRRRAHHRLGIVSRADQRIDDRRSDLAGAAAHVRGRRGVRRHSSGHPPRGRLRLVAPADRRRMPSALERALAPPDRLRKSAARCIPRRSRERAIPRDRSTASCASAGSVVASPEPARYIVSARDAAFARRSPSPHHSFICFAAHSGDRSSWHVVQALGMPNCAVFSGTGAWNV